MNKKRPINLDLSTLSFPPMAIVSILHRLSGLAIFLLLPFILYLVSNSLRSPADFMAVQSCLSTFSYKFFLWIFISAWIFHLIAGIRHMIMEAGIGEDLPSGRYSAIFVITLSLILALLLGIWLW